MTTTRRWDSRDHGPDVISFTIPAQSRLGEKPSEKIKSFIIAQKSWFDDDASYPLRPQRADTWCGQVWGWLRAALRATVSDGGGAGAARGSWHGKQYVSWRTRPRPRASWALQRARRAWWERGRDGHIAPRCSVSRFPEAGQRGDDEGCPVGSRVSKCIQMRSVSIS